MCESLQNPYREMAEAKTLNEREGTMTDRDQLLRILNLIGNDKINLGDVKVCFSTYNLSRDCCMLLFISYFVSN